MACTCGALAVWSADMRLPVDGGSVELYADGRYIAVTGDTWGDTPRRLGDLSGLIDALL